MHNIESPFQLANLGHSNGNEKLYPQWGQSFVSMPSPQLKQKFWYFINYYPYNRI